MKKMDLFGTNKPSETGGPKHFTERELLSRLACYLKESPYIQGDLLVFKGGLFLGEHTGKPRYTQDVDVSIASADVYARMREVLKDFGEELIAEDIIHEYAVEEAVLPNRSGGAKYRDMTGRVLLSIDVSLGGDELSCIVMDTSIAGRVHLESIEQVLADKLTVLYSRKRFRRSKDLFDIWQILSCCQVNISHLRELLKVRELLPLPLDKAPFNEEHYVQLEHAYNTLSIRDASTEELVEKPPFAEVVRVVGKFTMQFMEAEV